MWLYPLKTELKISARLGDCQLRRAPVLAARRSATSGVSRPRWPKHGSDWSNHEHSAVAQALQRGLPTRTQLATSAGRAGVRLQR